MSKAANEILKLIKEVPDTFYMAGSRPMHGITNGDVLVTYFGMPRFLSIISVYVKNVEIKTSYMDRWGLEVALKKWFKTTELKKLFNE